MGTKNQAMRAKKDARRKKNSGKETPLHKKTYGACRGTPLGDRNIYDIINNAREMARRSKKGLSSKEAVTWADLGAGLSLTMDKVIQVHSAIQVFLKLVGEGKIQITPAHEDLIERYEREVIHLKEDADAFNILDKTTRKPEDFTDMVLSMANVMNELGVFLNTEVLRELKQYEPLINAYVTEHIPSGINVYEYMVVLHEERIKELDGKYDTVGAGGSNAFTMADELLSPLDMPLDELIAQNNIEDLPTPDAEEDGPLLTEIPELITEEQKEEEQQ